MWICKSPFNIKDIAKPYLLNNWGKPAQAPVSGAFSPRNIEMIRKTFARVITT
jgi:hypothetical protein